MNTIPVRKISTTLRDQATAGSFSIREVERVLDGQNLFHSLHRHDFFFVLAIQNGEGIHVIDFIEYPVRDQSIFIVRPGQVHQLELNAGSTGFLMEFDRSFYQPKYSITEHRWKKASGKNYCEVDETRFVRLRSILKNMFDEYSAKNEGFLEAIKANLDLFFIEYIRQSPNVNSIANTPTAYDLERFEQFVQLVEKNVSSMKQVSDYADLLNVSPYQLNSITKASAGKTVSEIINEQIILEAKRYLTATPDQVKEIADHLGYEDVSYFVRFFKKHTGVSPAAFRDSLKLDSTSKE